MSNGSAEENFVVLRIVYNGQPHDDRANIHQPLRPVLERSLAHFGVQPAQPGEWGLRLEGQQDFLDLETSIKDIGLPSPAVLFLERRTPPRGGLRGVAPWR